MKNLCRENPRIGQPSFSGQTKGALSLNLPPWIVVEYLSFSIQRAIRGKFIFTIRNIMEKIRKLIFNFATESVYFENLLKSI